MTFLSGYSSSVYLAGSLQLHVGAFLGLAHDSLLFSWNFSHVHSYKYHVNIFMKPGMMAMPVIPALGSLKQENLKIKASVGDKERPCLKNQ
jgi:hypothetical protein